MKKLTVLLMSMLLIFSLAACSATPSDKDSSDSTSPSQEQTSNTPDPVTTSEGSSAEPTDSSEPTNTTGGKTLVVYYSATGNTEGVAKYIAAATGGDSFELVPKDDYTSADLNYNNLDSRVVYEHDHPEARNIELVKSTVDKLGRVQHRIYRLPDLVAYCRMAGGRLCEGQRLYRKDSHSVLHLCKLRT